MKRLLIAFALLAGASDAMAGSLTLPWVWTQSMPSVPELNESFTAVEVAVDDNDARLDAILSTDTCTTPPCDLTANTTVGGLPIATGSGAPTTATYLVQTLDAGLSNEIAFGAAVSNQFVTGVAGGVVTRAQPSFSDLSGSATDGQIPNTITVDLATVASTANAGDSATAFFSSGAIEASRIDTAMATESEVAAGYQPLGTSVEVTIALSGGAGYFSTTVTGQAWVAAGTEINCTPFGTTADGLTPEVVAIASLQLSASDRVVGTGFNLNVYSPNGLEGTIRAHCQGV